MEGFNCRNYDFEAKKCLLNKFSNVSIYDIWEESSIVHLAHDMIMVYDTSRRSSQL
jgi:hypothetical protein